MENKIQHFGTERLDVNTVLEKLLVQIDIIDYRQIAFGKDAKNEKLKLLRKNLYRYHCR